MEKMMRTIGIFLMLIFMDVALSSSRGARASEDYVGSGEVSCVFNGGINSCTFVSPVVSKPVVLEFYLSDIREDKRHLFEADCFNGGCIVTISGIRPSPMSGRIKLIDISWKKK